MANIPDDILTEILLRLPAKTLVRFWGVCKWWKTLITCKSFVRTHLSLARSRLFFLYGTPFPSFKITTYSLCCAETPGKELVNLRPPFHRFLKTELVGSCNGVLCMSCMEKENHSTIFLWNPSTMEYRKLPETLKRLPHHADIIDLGFGFHTLSDGTEDYKVVKIGKEDSGSSEVEIYSLRTDSWKSIGNAFPSTLNISHISSSKSHVMINGSIHWLASKHKIVTFNMADEVFGQMELPGGISPYPLNLTVLDGCLSFFVHHYRTSLYYTVWVMKEYGVFESWSKQYVINQRVDIMISECRHIKMGARPLVFAMNGELILESSAGILLSYDPNSKRGRKIGIKASIYSTCATTFVESLVSVAPGNVILG